MSEKVQKGMEGRRKRPRSQLGVQLTQRDREILNFLLEMKFASIDDLYRKFFHFPEPGRELIDIIGRMSIDSQKYIDQIRIGIHSL